jgi:hypothetical protein
MSPLLARMRVPTGSAIIPAYRGRAEVVGAQSEWREGPGTDMAGQVCQLLIFSDVSNNDRRLQNPEEHDGSITVHVGVYR